MGLILRLSIRNLLRQKKRNMFLGIGIAFGMMILVIANSFSTGMVDVLIQDVVSNAFGHLVVSGTPGNSFYAVIRDKERIEGVIREVIPPEDIVLITENLGVMGTAIGNGESDNVFVVGVTTDTEEEKEAFFTDFFTLVEGDFADFTSYDYEYPVIISQEMGRSLNVGLHDVIRLRVPMVTGQIQAVRLTVIAIANANNSFMNIVLFLDGGRVKELLGYRPWESAALQVTLRDPKRTAAHYADLIHQQLHPELLYVAGEIGGQTAQILAFQNNLEAKETVQDTIVITTGDLETALASNGVMMSENLAQRLKLQPGDQFTFTYETKFREMYSEQFTINAIFQSDSHLGDEVVFVNEERIHTVYNRYLPLDTKSASITADSVLYSILATEWKLLERNANAQEMMKQMRDERRIRTTQTKFQVMTMYEGASQILQLEEALNLITILAVLVLFFIILIGVMNTLRMTVRERTREIGTVRAIGMQKRDVRRMFMYETLVLTTLSCMAGVLIGIIVMRVLGTIEFDTNSVLSIILKNKRLFFKLNPAAMLSNFILIMCMAGVTAYFPARRAARLSAVEALRHYE